MLKRIVLTKTTPEVTITVSGNSYKVISVSSVQTVALEFVLGTPYEYDPGTGEVGKFVTTLEGNALVTKEAETGREAFKREFTANGMVIYLYADGVTATRTFKRA